MSFLDKERLYAITDLSSDKIIRMNDEKLAAYQETLTNAVNLFPIQKERLEDALGKMEYAGVFQWIKAIRNTLTQIHADTLAKQCDKQLALYPETANVRHDKLKTFIEFLMATLTMLYMEIEAMLEVQEVRNKPDPKAAYIKSLRAHLFDITELNKKAIERMNESQLKSYVKDLKSFRNNCATQETGLRGALKIKNYASVMRWLGTIEGSLTQIYADNLVEECRHEINLHHELTAIKHEKLEVFVNYLLSSIALLCEDIDTLKADE